MENGYFHRFFKEILLASLSLLLLIVLISLRFWFISINSPEEITRKVQKNFLSVNQSLEYDVDELLVALGPNPHNFKNIIDTLDSEFQFYCFLNDSLIGWNGNWLSYNDLFALRCNSRFIQTSNGMYIAHCSKILNSVRIIGVQLIQNNYRYENKYLKNGFILNNKTISNVIFSKSETKYAIYDQYNEPVAYLDIDQRDEFSDSQYVSILLCYILFHISIVLLIISAICKVFRKKSSVGFGMWIGIIVIIVFRLFQEVFRFPSLIYSHQVFGPQIFTLPGIAFSFGDFILNILTLFVLVVTYKRKVKVFPCRFLGRHFSLNFLAGFVIILLYSFLLISILKAIVFDSIIPFNFNQIYNFNGHSIIGLTLIATFIYSGYELIAWIFGCIEFLSVRKRFIIAYLAATFFIVLIISIIGYLDPYVILLATSVMLLFTFWRWRNQVIGNTTLVVVYILLHSLIGAIAIYSLTENKEDNKQVMAASHLSAEQRDPVVEYLFSSLEKRFERDVNLSQKLDSARENFDYPIIEKKIRDQYFDGYWTNFDIQLTICEPYDTLKLIPEKFKQNCYHYFQGLISDFGEPTSFRNLQFINYGPGDKSYLASFIIKTNKKEYKIYAEITPKNYGSELGLPDLLVDERKGTNLLDISYSTALYINGNLYSHSGEYNYQNNSILNIPPEVNYKFIEIDNFRHLYHRASNQKQIVVSRKNLNVFEKGATFTFILLVFSTFFIIALMAQKGLFKSSGSGMKSQLQRFISSVLVLSFVVTGVFAVYYINQFNSSKVTGNLNEKTHSVLLEIQYKLASNPGNTISKDYFDELLFKFSSVFFSDINIYGLDGRLISTSRPQIFNEGIIGDQMNPEAFYQMSANKKSFIIHNEQIGGLKFLSSYMPIKDYNNEVIAYLNLPYFARQSELKVEILAFLVRFVNIFLLILIAALAFGFLLANYFSKPLQLLINNMKTVTFSGRNVVLEWKKDDEIGALINQYNQLLIELQDSAKRLAESERESAWREMARQIAHEIKNPLTPMKLSIQFLKKAWNDNDPKWEEKYLHFTSTMIEQIDSLSRVASDFSDFSTIKASSIEPVSIIQVAQNAVGLFSGNLIHIDLKFDHAQNPLILADKDQILRLFNNLLKNAVQAIEQVKDGKILVKVVEINDRVNIEFSDNGNGIPSELADKIFQPNFTTKTGGMGLGLAISKTIAENFDGSLGYYTNQDAGTTFTVTFPTLKHF